MIRAALTLGFIGGVSLASAQGPTPSGAPAFEVASIRRSAPNQSGTRIGTQPGGRWIMTNMAIAGLIHSAYETQARELIGAPEWVTTERYDVDARALGNPPNEQITLMLRSLLAERFKLSIRTEMQERPVFALVMAREDRRLGPNLVPSQIDCNAVNAARRQGQPPPPTPQPANGAPLCGMRMSAGDGVLILFGSRPLGSLAGTLGRPDGRVVVDKTGLTGNYDLTLRYTDRPDPSGDVPSLFTALEEQLGLKLVADRAPLEVLVVDRIERPSEN